MNERYPLSEFSDENILSVFFFSRKSLTGSGRENKISRKTMDGTGFIYMTEHDIEETNYRLTKT